MMKLYNHKLIRNQKGFTMVETMVVVAIIGILTMMAIPSYNGFIAHQRLSGAAREIFSDIKAARALAIQTGTQYGIAFPGSPPVNTAVSQFQAVIPGTIGVTTYYTFAEAAAVVGAGYNPTTVSNYDLGALGYLGVTVTVPASLPVFQKNGLVAYILTPSGGNCCVSTSGPANFILTSSTGEQKTVSINAAGLATIN